MFVRAEYSIRRGVRRHVEMNDTPTLVSQDDEAVERAKDYRLRTPITAP